MLSLNKIRNTLLALTVAGLAIVYPFNQTNSLYAIEPDSETVKVDDNRVVMTIGMDPGGNIKERLSFIKLVKATGNATLIRINGPCISSCGLLLGVRSNLCYVNDNAVFWFHKPFAVDVETGEWIADGNPWDGYLDYLPADIAATLVNRGFIALPDRHHYIKIPAKEFIRPCSREWVSMHS